jgi:UDP-N-acetylglucosamine--N-acetylmuramyl-(pentapeptide) pyrophosphoryl-undecaprenol N-acetylglucosamine transferase
MKKILVAAGGTGGHLFPAVAVVEKLKNEFGAEIDFQFFGRDDKIESKVVPQLGYKLHLTKLNGLTKLISFNTLKLPFQIYNSIRNVKKIINDENIDAVLCAGAYLSYPAGVAARKLNKKLFLMESNVNPGKANMLLADRADIIFTTFDETPKYFNQKYIHKIQNWGNPVRNQILNFIGKDEAIKKLNLDNTKPIILIFGGSLGAKSINDAVINNIDKFASSNLQLIWQTGNSNNIDISLPKNIRLLPFIDDMATAYSAADIVVSRSGATTVAELGVVGKPSILVPLPSAANNEQYYNARYFDNNGAAILIDNTEISNKIYETIIQLINNKQKLNNMSVSAKKLGNPNASEKIAKVIGQIIFA